MYETQGVAFYISPKKKGLISLCVTLTDDGRRQIDDFYQNEARTRSCTIDEVGTEKILYLIDIFCNAKFCRQKLFEAVDHDCAVLDLRSKEEIFQQILQLVNSGRPFEYWGTKLPKGKF